MPPVIGRPPQEAPSKTSPWLVLGGFGLGGLLLAALALWLLWGGTATVMSWLPSGVVRSLGEKVGEPKVVEPVADPEGAPWKAKAYTNQARAGDDDEAALPGAASQDQADEDPTGDAALAKAALAQVVLAAAAADRAIEAWQKKPGDQGLRVAAERSIDALHAAEIPAKTPALRQAALEQRAELVAQKRKFLADLQRMERATHTVSVRNGGMATLRTAGEDSAAEVAQLGDTTSVHVFLDNGHGWSRVEVLTGDHAGKNGYLRNRNLNQVVR